MPLGFDINPILAKEQFSTDLKHELTNSRLIYEAHMVPYQIPYGKASIQYSVMGDGEDAVIDNTRLGRTQYQDIGARTRKYSRDTLRPKAIMFTPLDLMETGETLPSHYAKKLAQGISRKKNAIFRASFEATVSETQSINASGQTVETTVAFPQSNIIRADFDEANQAAIGSNYAGVNAADLNGLTVEKLVHLNTLMAQNKLIGADVDVEYPGCVMTVTYANINNLLRDPLTSSTDYKDFFVRDSMGKLIRFMDIEFMYVETHNQEVAASVTLNKLYAWNKEAFIMHSEDVKEKVVFPWADNSLADVNEAGYVNAETYYKILRVREEFAYRIDVKA